MAGTTPTIVTSGVKVTKIRSGNYTVSALNTVMFEFDPNKSAANFAKHGIDFVVAQALWRDDRRLVVDAQFVTEPRQLVIGRVGGRLWTAVVTERGDQIRIISVRRSRDSEESAYDAQGD